MLRSFDRRPGVCNDTLTLAETLACLGVSQEALAELVATGRLELMLDPVMNAWDSGPFGIILPEAGGYHGDWSGRETIYGGEALSTTRRLLPEVLAVIRGASEVDGGAARDGRGG